MTRPKADTDPWLLDPIARDKIVAKEVVYGIRQMVLLLRGIRDDLEESRGLRGHIADLQREVRDLQAEVDRNREASYESAVAGTAYRGGRRLVFEPCDSSSCVLPSGHMGNHRGSVHDGAYVPR